MSCRPVAVMNGELRSGNQAHLVDENTQAAFAGALRAAVGEGRHGAAVANSGARGSGGSGDEVIGGDEFLMDGRIRAGHGGDEAGCGGVLDERVADLERRDSLRAGGHDAGQRAIPADGSGVGSRRRPMRVACDVNALRGRIDEGQAVGDQR